MKILALDTSSNACSVALLEGSQQDFSCTTRFEIAPRQHTQLILPMIDSVLDSAGYDIKEIDVLAFACGPGAFTGVRVATGVVQAISYGADLPVAAISSLASLAQGFYHANENKTETVTKRTKVLVASDARMNEVYFAAYELKEKFMTLIDAEYVIKPQDLETKIKNTLILDGSWQRVGNGWSVYADALLPVSRQCASQNISESSFETLSYPNAKEVAYLALKECRNNTLLTAEQVRPVYLRNNVAKKSKKN